MSFISFLLVIAAASAAPSSADIEIKSARLDFARPSNTLGYSAIVANNGPDEARNVEVTIMLPPGAKVRRQEPCALSLARELVRCAIGTMKPGEERRLFMLVLTSERKPDMVAFAVSDAQDPDAWNNARRAETP